MKYTLRQYAEALYEALEGTSDAARAEVVKNFMLLLTKHHVSARVPQILREYEKIFLHKQGLTKVSIESASSLPERVRQEIEKTIGKKVFLVEKVNPELIAGLTIVVDDTYSIDASAKTKINKLFT